MATPGKQRILNYGLEFKLRAVQLSNQHGVLVKDVAASLDIHPFMLSKWRKQVRARARLFRRRRIGWSLPNQGTIGYELQARPLLIQISCSLCAWCGQMPNKSIDTGVIAAGFACLCAAGHFRH